MGGKFVVHATILEYPPMGFAVHAAAADSFPQAWSFALAINQSRWSVGVLSLTVFELPPRGVRTNEALLPVREALQDCIPQERKHDVWAYL